MKIRNLAFAALATATLAGCATGYSYRGGGGDYYYGRPSVEYYGYGAPYGSIGYGYPGGWNGSIGYGGGYGSPYGYYGYGYGGYPGYAYRPYYPYYPYYPYPRNPRPPQVERPDRTPDGYPLPDNGVRYQSRFRGVPQGSPPLVMQPEYQVQGSPAAAGVERYPSRYQSRVPQGLPSLESRGQLQRGGPVLAPPQGMQQAPRREIRYESRTPRMEAPPARATFRDRDDGRAEKP